MTSLDFRCRDRCAVCGFRLRGILCGSFRVNKFTLRATAVSLTFVERLCPECGHPAPMAADHWALTTESQARVDAIRAKRGWT